MFKYLPVNKIRNVKYIDNEINALKDNNSELRT